MRTYAAYFKLFPCFMSELVEVINFVTLRNSIQIVAVAAASTTAAVSQTKRRMDERESKKKE